MSVLEAFEEHLDVVTAAKSLVPTIEAITTRIRDCLRSGGKVLVAGNGGSAADAQHFVAEFIGRYRIERAPLAALALTTDSSILTCIANDYAYADVFSRQILGLGRKGDVFIAISTSGNSENVLRAADAAKKLGIEVFSLTGRGGGKLKAKSDLCLEAPSAVVARVQEVHELALHAIAEGLDQP